jgi:hypothetical protein
MEVIAPTKAMLAPVKKAKPANEVQFLNFPPHGALRWKLFRNALQLVPTKEAEVDVDSK